METHIQPILKIAEAMVSTLRTFVATPWLATLVLVLPRHHGSAKYMQSGIIGDALPSPSDNPGALVVGASGYYGPRYARTGPMAHLKELDDLKFTPCGSSSCQSP